MISCAILAIPIALEKYQFLILKGHSTINCLKEFELDVFNSYFCAKQI